MKKQKPEMKKIAKIKGLVSKETRLEYLNASAAQRAALLSEVLSESRWMIDRMAAKGYRLEATVADVLGVFTRGAAAGTVKLVAPETELPGE